MDTEHISTTVDQVPSDLDATAPNHVRKPIHRAEGLALGFEQLLDSDEAAALLKIHPKTLQRMARNHEIVGVQIGKLWRFRASMLNGWLEQRGRFTKKETP